MTRHPRPRSLSICARFAAASLLLLAAGCGPSQAELDARMASVRSELAATLSGQALPAASRTDLQQRRAWKAVQTFYQGDAPETVWVDGTGPRERVDSLIAALRGADGIERDEDAPEAEKGAAAGDDATAPNDDYAVRQLAELRDRARKAVDDESPEMGRSLADLELAASYAFLARAIHVVDGHVDPETLNVLWFTEGRKAKPLELLARVRDGAEPDAVLTGLEPQHEAYRRLLEARKRYRRIVADGGWPTVPGEGETLEEGAHGPRVAALRRRLAAEGYLEDAAEADATEDGGAGAAYDATVTAAVEEFQKLHGIDVDGKVGSGTLEALNVPAAQRLTTLEVNLERWRWMPGKLGERYIEVNIPEYRLRAVRDGKTDLEMKVIVGKRFHETPVFSDTMTFVVFNPEWNIPESIAGDEVVPKILSDPGYAERQGIEVVDADGNRVPATSVLGQRARPEPQEAGNEERGGFFANLFGGGGEEESAEPAQPQRVTSLPKGYRLRQVPGQQNPLGQVKFMFPNEHNIYLHDTPADSLFSSTDRDFSHGCIRLERPLELADYVLRGSDWTPERIRQTVAGEQRTEAKLPEPLPVHLTYFTAWVDDDGRVEFRDDLYGHDARLAQALAAEPPLSLDLDELHNQKVAAK